MEDEIIEAPFQFFQPWKIFFWEAFLFSLILGLGLAAAFELNQLLALKEIIFPQTSFWGFFITFLLATLFILLLIRFLKFRKEKGVIFKMIFVLVILLGGLLFFKTWLPESFSLIIVISLIFWWLKRPSILNHDLLMIFGLAGAGSTLGLTLQPLTVVALLIFFSVYDYIAVYKTKHMVKMAREMLEQQAILALVVPSEISGFWASLAEIRPGGKFLILGGGDVVFPLLFSVSLMPAGILNSIIIAIFSLIGLFFSFYIFIRQEVRQPIPALPPIAAFSLLGYSITKIFH